MKPQLIKRKNASNTNIRIIVEPSKGRSASLDNISKPKPIAIKQVTQAEPIKPANAAVSRAVKRNKVNQVNRKSQVRYVSRDIDNDSLAKIKQLRNSSSPNLGIALT
jgi:hypothetical protein